jgi:peptidoglycan/LPS O-acetylase OafA/YrhL
VRAWWPYLDLARGVAALLVALSHLRGFVFVDFHSLDHPGLVWSVFYFATGAGHEAVMAFFVLSGFLVGGTVVSRCESGQWSWSDYAITRMTRLWIVLLPALILTALWDNLGIAITGSSFYNGGMTSTYNSGPAADPSRYNVASFVGNAAFLQTIGVPTFGSNVPLWSLANEFWYYVLFPLGFLAVATKAQAGVKCGSAAIALIICYALPTELLIYGSIWLLGVAIFSLHSKVTLPRPYRNILLALSGTSLAVALTLSRTLLLDGFVADFAIGATFAAMLLPLSQIRRATSMVAKISRVGAEFSYTLYLVHFPIAAFFACYVLSNQRLMPGFASAVIYLGLLAVIVLYAYGVYFLFERNTRVTRQAISQLVARSRASRAPKASTK